MSIEAMKMALEALESDNPDIQLRAAIALRQAIEQAEQAQPVVHTLNCVCGATWDIKADGSEEMVNAPNSTPPQRRPLTHPQIHELDWPDGVAFEDILLFARAIEAAHGIKGEA